MSESLSARARFVCDRVAETARLMVGVPDYPTYVAHRKANHPDRADHDLRGVLSRAAAGALRRQQGAAARLLLSGPGAD